MNTEETTVIPETSPLTMAGLENSVLARIKTNKGGFGYLSGLVVVRCNTEFFVLVHDPQNCIDETPFEIHWTPETTDWAKFMRLEISILDSDTTITLSNTLSN